MNYNWSAYPNIHHSILHTVHNRVDSQYSLINKRYEQLIQIVQKANLQIKVIMSFRIHFALGIIKYIIYNSIIKKTRTLTNSRSVRWQCW